MHNEEEVKFDVRVFIGLGLFYWQTIAVCFLYSLLAGVIYLQFAPKLYESNCKILVQRDRALEVGGPQSRRSPWSGWRIHVFFLKSDDLRKRVAEELLEKWGGEIGSLSKMMLSVDVTIIRAVGDALDIRVKARNPDYGEDFLDLLVDSHRKQWLEIQMVGSERATGMLDKELERLTEDIDQAENDLIEYQRLNDIARVEASASMESQYLSALMSRKSSLTTELMLLESQYPLLSDANAAVISDVGRLTRETGDIEPELNEIEEVMRKPKDGDDLLTRREIVRSPKVVLPENLTDEALPGGGSDAGTGWRSLRLKLMQFSNEEKSLLENLESNHPRVKALRKKIEDIQSQLDLAARSELSNLKDRHKALLIQKDAVEKAIYQWQAKNLLSSKRRSELKRLSGVLNRYEASYNDVYSRISAVKIKEELKADHFLTIQDVRTDRGKHVWPDPVAVLLLALGVGLASGFGLSIVGYILNNKIQTVADVEKELKMTFLGGIPFWVQSGLEQTVRPIVTEEFSTGATEAYRSLRTSVLKALADNNENILLMTSADSREGKTLTTLNMAIMIAQTGKKVLLIDMDLRRGRLHRSLGVEKEPGMTGVLTGEYALKDVVMQSRIDNLYAVSSGKSISNTAELLQARDLKALFADVKAEYDYVLIDTSPVLRVTDTVIMAAQQVGAVVYVARMNKTPKPMIKYSLSLLENANVLGMVMNSIELHKISSLYYAYQYPAYAYYSNAYAYGYDYYDDKGGKRRPSRSRPTSWRRKWHSVEKWAKRTFLPME